MMAAGVAKTFEAGKLTDEDLALAKESAPRLVRAQKGELGVDDLLATPKDMPCQDTPAKNKFLQTYAARAGAQATAWATASRVSEDLRVALGSKELEGVTAWREASSARAEPAAARAILSGKPEELEGAKALCDFQSSFGVGLGKKCAGLLAFMATKKR